MGKVQGQFRGSCQEITSLFSITEFVRAELVEAQWGGL